MQGRPEYFENADCASSVACAYKVSVSIQSQSESGLLTRLSGCLNSQKHCQSWMPSDAVKLPGRHRALGHVFQPGTRKRKEHDSSTSSTLQVEELLRVFKIYLKNLKKLSFWDILTVLLLSRRHVTVNPKCFSVIMGIRWISRYPTLSLLRRKALIDSPTWKVWLKGPKGDFAPSHKLNGRWSLESL